jgi:phosphoribosylpyrophosphate synthetase
VIDEFLLFAGSASRALGRSISEYLDCPLGASETVRFSEGNLFVRVLENVRGQAVSDRFISAATDCIHASVAGASRMHTAAGLPRNRSVVKASTW